MADLDLLVVGGGIVGASAAFHAARARARVLQVDRDDPGRATAAGAGIVSPETDIHHGGAYLDLARRAAAYYSTLLDALPRRAGYQRCGMLVVAADEEEARDFDAFAAAALAREPAAGASAADALALIEPTEAGRLFPPLAKVERALWNPRGARVDGREVTAALHEAALAAGVTRLPGSVEALVVERGGEIEMVAATAGSGVTEPAPARDRGAAIVRGAVVDGERHDAAAVVIAGGAWSPALLAALGRRLPVAPQRGQIAHLHLEGADSAGWPMVSGFHDHYLVAWPGGRVAAGATRETGSGFDSRPTAAGIREVLAEALRLAPGLAAATLLEIRVGLRPLAADRLPILGPVPGIAGLWIATGHGPAGLTLGPWSGKVVAEAALGAPWDPELEPFSLARFERG